MIAKLKMLKEVLRQMQCAMADGHADSESAGEDAMDSLSEKGEDKVAEASKMKDGIPGGGGSVENEDDDFASEKKEYMKSGGKKLPMGGKGVKAIMMSVAAKKPPMGKKSKYG